MVEAGIDSQGDHVLNRVLAYSKFDLDETANRIKDRRFALEDKMRQAGILVDSVKRMMRAFNRAYARVVRQLEEKSVEEQLEELRQEDEDIKRALKAWDDERARDDEEECDLYMAD